MPDPFPHAEIPLPEGVGAVPPPAQPAAPPSIPGPLPFNYKVNADGRGYDKYGYSHTAVAKDWRSPTEKLATYSKKPQSDHLFELTSILQKQPGTLLNPAPLDKVAKRAKNKADADERDRRAALGDAARAMEDEKITAEKWMQARDLSRRTLACRIGRKAYNYGVGLTTTPSEIPAEQLATINSEISKVLPDDDDHVLTSEQAVTWLTHAVPLSEEVKKYMNAGSRLSSYQSVTKDIYELLMVSELTDGRFNGLEVRATPLLIRPRCAPICSSVCDSAHEGTNHEGTTLLVCLCVCTRVRRVTMPPVTRTSRSRSSSPRPSASVPSRRRRRGVASGTSWLTSRSSRTSCRRLSRRR